MTDSPANPLPARFTILVGHWYAAEFIGDEFAQDASFRHYSPIRVDAVEPVNSGIRRFYLTFYHSNYPEGVQGKRYLLQTLERSHHYVLARSTEHSPPRVLLIYEITWPWLNIHFGVEQPSDSDDIIRWLTNHA